MGGACPFIPELRTLTSIMKIGLRLVVSVAGHSCSKKIIIKKQGPIQIKKYHRPHFASCYLEMDIKKFMAD